LRNYYETFEIDSDVWLDEFHLILDDPCVLFDVRHKVENSRISCCLWSIEFLVENDVVK